MIDLIIDVPWQMWLLGALSLSIGWGIRGNFGHEVGAALPGALAAMAEGRWQAEESHLLEHNGVATVTAVPVHVLLAETEVQIGDPRLMHDATTIPVWVPILVPVLMPVFM